MSRETCRGKRSLFMRWNSRGSQQLFSGHLGGSIRISHELGGICRTRLDPPGQPGADGDSRSYLEGETFEKDGNILQAYILNPEPETLPAEKCSIAGIRVDTGTPEGKNIYINLPGGIVMGQSLEENVTEAYGEPVDRYQGEEGMVPHL